jgi:hypothetical protein
VQLSRIRLLPRVCDGKALIGPGMKDTRFWEPLVNQSRDDHCRAGQPDQPRFGNPIKDLQAAARRSS